MTAPRILRLAQVSSTLDVVHGLAAEGAMSGTVVAAEEQLAGRGTRGRTWHSPRGGLWYSILYRDVSEAGLEVLSLRIGLAVASVIESLVSGIRLGLKWPNDLMLGDRKLGGILCEARWQGDSLGWVAVGIGVNVTNAIPSELADSAVSLDSVIPGIAVEQLVAPLTDALRALPLDVSRLSTEELAGYQGRDWLQGKVLVEPVPGIGRGLAADGSLMVEKPDGTIVSARAGRALSG